LKNGCPSAEVGVDGRILNWILKKNVVGEVDWIIPAQERDKL
jgi:hypothetical protein